LGQFCQPHQDHQILKSVVYLRFDRLTGCYQLGGVVRQRRVV
jgi:hypothetical protein